MRDISFLFFVAVDFSLKSECSLPTTEILAVRDKITPTMNTSDLNLFLQSLRDEAERLNFSLAEETLDLLGVHYELLVKWNRRIRLVGSIESRRAASELYADSLVAAAFAELFAERSASVIDIGTGAGFPGIPVKLAHPVWPVTLVESNAKKVSFLKEVERSLGWEGVRIIQARAEELAHTNEYREKYDLAFCRAVAEPAAACELATPFLKVGGSFILQAQEDYDHSALSRAAAKVHIKVTDSRPYRLSGLESRLVVRLLKARSTPLLFPRNLSIIKKHPL